MTGPCIRRWYTTWSTCPCDPCVTTRARYRKHHDAGLTQRVTSAQAWTVLENMINRGWTNTAIATASNIPRRSVIDLTRGHRAGHHRVIGAVIAHRIVNHGKPTAGYVGALGSTRRLQALAAIGWTGDTITQHTHGTISRMAISTITRGTSPRIRPHIADTIDTIYRALHTTPGPSQPARDRAAEHRWAPPAAWDRIDDPHDTPQGIDHPTRIPAAELLAEIDRLADLGATIHDTVRATGRTYDALEMFLRRQDRADLLHRLRNQAA